MKFIILGIIIYIVYFLFFRKPSLSKDDKKLKDSETVVECQECGVYTSVNEIVLRDGKQYCSKECAKLK